MVEFNPDGSLKLPGSVIKSRAQSESKMRTQRCLKIRREIVNHSAPKKCILTITPSDALHDLRFIENIYSEFKERAATPTKIIAAGPREYKIEIGSDFKRCSDCTALRGRYREFLYGNTIDEKGNCTFEGRMKSWNEEDYFE